MGGRMDIAVNLVESYLRLAGYLTLSEFEVQRRLDDGTFASITDVDIVAVRMPGDVFIGDPHDEEHGGLLLVEDPELRLDPDCVDVIVGEVKQGEATFNANLKDHHVLHSVLRRLEWMYDEPLLAVVEGLQRELTHRAPARGGGTVRTRLVAFGRTAQNSVNMISHSHVIRRMLHFFDAFEDALQPVQFKQPATAMLRLLRKTGFDVTKPPPPTR